MNFTIQWVLTPEIVLWRFGIPSRLQLPKWELTWECGGSFPHTPRSMKCDSRATFLAHTLASSCLGHEPKLGLRHTCIKHGTWWLRIGNFGCMNNMIFFAIMHIGRGAWWIYHKEGDIFLSTWFCFFLLKLFLYVYCPVWIWI
jgi:hypothetical protein